MSTKVIERNDCDSTKFDPEKHTESSTRRDSSEVGDQHVIQFVPDTEDNWKTDPANARNWSARRKWTATTIVSLYTFLTPFASTVMAPGISSLNEKYHITSPTISAMTLSVYLLSNAIGPLVLAPFSETFGRTWVLHTGNILSTFFHLGCAFAPKVGILILFRFLAGLAGGAAPACGAGSISDLFSERDRASAMALYSLGPLIGPIMGPIVGGFIADSVGVKYLFIFLAGICGFVSVVAIPLLQETYGPVLRYRKAVKLGDVEKATALSKDIPATSGEIWSIVLNNLTRPVTLLSRSFICFILSLYMAFTYGITFMFFTTFGDVFGTIYGFDPSVVGLAYIGLGIGFIIATIIGARFSNQMYSYLASKNDGKGKPEMRMPALFFGSFFIPVGLLWFGWSAQARIHWIMPIIGSGIFGFGTMTNFLPIQLYLVDAFTYAASAVAASMVFRSLLGFTFPLFGQQMYNRLGLGYGNTLLAALGAILGIPFPVWIYYCGESIRSRSPLTRST